MIKYFIIFNSQGKVRLHKAYGKDKGKEALDSHLKLFLVEDSQLFLKTLFQLITQQTTNSSNYFAIPSMPKGTRAVYRRYASLYIVTVIDAEESELALFDLIHMIAEGFDALFENASELDILFNPEKVYLLLDEIIVGGTIIETNLKETLEAFKLHTNIRNSAVTSTA